MPEGNRASVVRATSGSLPTLVGVEHIAATVPDLDQAVAFFVGVLGGALIRRSHFESQAGGTDMAERFNAHPEAVAELATLDLHGVVLELFEYHAPDLAQLMPRNCDPGGHHIGFRVGDVKAAAGYLRTVPGVTVLGEPSTDVREGVHREWVYFLSPWGLQLEIASEESSHEPEGPATSAGPGTRWRSQPRSRSRLSTAPPSLNGVISPMTATAPPSPWPAVTFGPRRLGHVNMYVSDLDRSYAFYRDVCGLQLVFDEVGLFAKFLSNGNSHHDVAIMEASSKTLVGRDGEVQKSSRRGTEAGLNHLAFEMATESLLVEGITRARAAGFPIESTYDHLISRSVYLLEPDGLSLELYADSTSDWRGLYASLGTELLSARWEPGAHGPPSRTPRYVQTLDHRPVADAVARPVRTARATLVVAELETSVVFYQQVIGLDILEADLGDGRWAILHGSLGLPDLLVLEQQAGQSLGFHHFSLELSGVEELDATITRARRRGVPIVRTVEHGLKRGVVVEDPDGVPVEFYAPLSAAKSTFSSVATASTREYLA